MKWLSGSTHSEEGDLGTEGKKLTMAQVCVVTGMLEDASNLQYHPITLRTGEKIYFWVTKDKQVIKELERMFST